MHSKTEAKLAWTVSNLIENLQSFLWSRYMDSFVEFCLKEEQPDHQVGITDVDDDLPF